MSAVRAVASWGQADADRRAVERRLLAGRRLRCRRPLEQRLRAAAPSFMLVRASVRFGDELPWLTADPSDYGRIHLVAKIPADCASSRSVLSMDWHGRFSPRGRARRVTLDPDDIDVIAERAAQRVAQFLERRPGAFQLLEPRQLARALNVSLDYVYAHAADLGVMRLGDGPKARLRFDLHTAEAAIRGRRQPSPRHAARL